MKFITFFTLLLSFNTLAVEYKYDGSNKLQQVIYDNGTVVNYEYDVDGNMTKVNPTDISTGDETPTDNGDSDNDTADVDNQNTETPESKKEESGGSVGFSLLFLFLALPLIKRFKVKRK